MSYPQIGLFFRKHHTTVLYSIERCINEKGRASMLDGAGRPLPLVRGEDLLRQARVIRQQGELIEILTRELFEIRQFAARAAGQLNLFPDSSVESKRQQERVQ